MLVPMIDNIYVGPLQMAKTSFCLIKNALNEYVVTEQLIS